MHHYKIITVDLQSSFTVKEIMYLNVNLHTNILIE